MTGPAVVPTLAAPATENQPLGRSHGASSESRVSTPIRNYGDVFRDRIFLCGATLCDLSLTRRTCRSRRVKVHLNGLADR